MGDRPSWPGGNIREGRQDVSASLILVNGWAGIGRRDGRGRRQDGEGRGADEIGDFAAGKGDDAG